LIPLNSYLAPLYQSFSQIKPGGGDNQKTKNLSITHFTWTIWCKLST